MSHSADTYMPSPQQRSGSIALRRGLVLVGMSALVPGSAQLAAGNRRVGRIAIRVWLLIVLFLLVFGLLAIPFRAFVIGVYANVISLTVLQVGVLLYAVGWIGLLVDAWRLADPKVMSRVGMAISGVLVLALVAAGASMAWTASGAFAAQRSAFGSIFGGGGSAQTHDGRYNVLLLGGDAGKDRTGLRPDSITVASIDAGTGRTVLFSLPRNMQRVPFPADSPLVKAFPRYANGYYCPEKKLADRCMLNGINTLANQHKKLFPGVKNPGIEATRASVEEVLGLKINYWAIIDMRGFRELIDAVGGIRLDIGKRVPIGSENGIYGYFSVGKNQHLDGYHALWFARSRVKSSDYERMLRQKCVMNAMLRQLDVTTVVTKFQAIAAAGEQIVATNVPSDQIGVLADLALKGKSLPMASVSFVPPTLKSAVAGGSATENPDFAGIRQTVATTIAASEALDKAGREAPASTPSTAKATKPKSGAGAMTNTDNLDSLSAICKASA